MTLIDSLKVTMQCVAMTAASFHLNRHMEDVERRGNFMSDPTQHHFSGVRFSDEHMAGQRGKRRVDAPDM